MADGNAVPLARAQRAKGKGVLFPLAPQPCETLLGYVARSLTWNHLGTPATFLKTLEVDLTIKGDLLSRLQCHLAILSELFCVEPLAISRLWGADPLSALGKRRLGGVYLRPQLVEQSRRRLPPSFGAEDSDQAIWMVRHLAFCPRTWEALVDRCPRPWCAKPLTWPSLLALDRCQHCGARVSEARVKKVPRKDRPALAWLVSLFDECSHAREQALARLPPWFAIDSLTDLYELVLALARAFHLSNSVGPPRSLANTAELAMAVRFLLEYPRSRWDLEQSVSPNTQPPFFSALLRVGRESSVPAVQNQIRRMLTEDVTAKVSEAEVASGSGYLSITEAAALLRVPRGSLRRVIEAGLLSPAYTSGNERMRDLFAERDIRRVRRELDQRMSWREFSFSSRLPIIAVEQLLAVEEIIPLDHEIAEVLHGERQLERASAAWFLRRLNNLPFAPTKGAWVPLEQAFSGVGALDKPWAPVLRDGLSGRLPGGLYWGTTRGGDSQLVVDETVARGLIMGGPDDRAWYCFSSWRYGHFLRTWLEPGEVLTHLNCQAQDLAWLKEHGFLQPIATEERSRFQRCEVEDLSRAHMTTREAAARLGVKPKDVWRVLEAYDHAPTIGQGFHARGALEKVLHAVIGEHR